MINQFIPAKNTDLNTEQTTRAGVVAEAIKCYPIKTAFIDNKIENKTGIVCVDTSKIPADDNFYTLLTAQDQQQAADELKTILANLRFNPRLFWIIEHPIKTNQTSSEQSIETGKNPLILAVEYNNIPVITVLLESLEPKDIIERIQLGRYSKTSRIVASNLRLAIEVAVQKNHLKIADYIHTVCTNKNFAYNDMFDIDSDNNFSGYV